MIFTDDLACRQYFRRRCTHRQKKEKSLDRLHFVYPSRMKRNTQICVEVKQRREIAQFIQRKKECDPKDRIASHVCNYCTSWRENLKTFPNL